MSPAVSVVVPTFRRPDGLERAVRSLWAQAGAPPFEIVCIDNSPEAGALGLLDRLAAESPVPLRWAHAAHPGVSNARNAGVALAAAPLIAWLDDDEAAPPGWLAALCAVQAATGADAVFGPVMGRLPPGPFAHRAYFEGLYSRTGPAHSGLSHLSHGIGNSLLVRATVLAAPDPFALDANETGGEDDQLFAAARAAGRRFAWAAEAGVIEHIDPARARLAHALRRAYSYGASPCQTAWRGPARDFVGLARHMGVGAAQATGFGAAALAGYLMGAPWRLWALDRTLRGLGKLGWWAQPRFYGAALALRG